MSSRFETFIAEIERAVASGMDEAGVLNATRSAMRRLVAVDDWLPARATLAHPQYYQQHLLYRDPAARFSVVSFVWGPGQSTPIHDHTVWGVIGMLRGSESSQGYRHDADGALTADGPLEVLEPGDIAAVSPRIGDIHRVRNVFDDRVSISIHVYGADIGAVRRHVFDPDSGEAKDFVSGYSQLTEAA
jgi:predicted metal-dependent enzyme (double-stranded beta helix superfamily)